MKLTIEPTDEFLQIDGQPFRIWRGHDEEDVPVEAMVRAVSPQTHDEDVAARFRDRLEKLPPLKQAGMVIDYRFVADEEDEQVW